MRFKPPPPGSPIGWRVEFRPLEVRNFEVCLNKRKVHIDITHVLQLQLTDFENAAFVVFVVILTRTILSFGLDFRIPISKVGKEPLCAVCDHPHCWTVG